MPIITPGRPACILRTAEPYARDAFCDTKVVLLFAQLLTLPGVVLLSAFFFYKI